MKMEMMEMTAEGCAAFKKSSGIDVEQVQSFWSPAGIRRIVFRPFSENPPIYDPLTPGYFLNNYPFVAGFVVASMENMEEARKFVIAGLIRDNACIPLSPREAEMWVAEARAARVYRDDRRQMAEPWLPSFRPGLAAPGRVAGQLK